MKSALLFYHKVVADLCSMGFELNPYDPCVANKMMDGHQMTICWHVDNFFLAHKNLKTVFGILQWLQACCETPDKPLKATCGALHHYLGMNIDFSTPGDVSFDMIPYLAEVLHDFPEKIMGVSSSLADNHLFKIRDPSKAHLLPESQEIAFHHTTAQLFSSCAHIGTPRLRLPCQSSQQR